MNSYIDDLPHSVLILSGSRVEKGCSGEVPWREEAVLIGQPPFCKGRRKRQGLVLTTVVLRKQIGKGETCIFQDWLLLGDGFCSLEAARFCDPGIGRPCWLLICPSSEWCHISRVLSLSTFSVLTPHRTFLFFSEYKISLRFKNKQGSSMAPRLPCLLLLSRVVGSP